MKQLRELRAAAEELQLKTAVRAEQAQIALAAEREKVRELAEALRMLHDYQNGCPLPSFEKGWNEAMAMTDAVLPKVEKCLETFK